MRFRSTGALMAVAAMLVVATTLADTLPPGRQHRLTIEGENTVTFVPEANLPEFKVDYQAKIEYIVDSRYGKEPKAPPGSDEKDDDKDEVSKTVARSSTATATKTKSRSKKYATPADPTRQPTGAIDVSLHSSERVFRQNGETIVEAKLSRSRFQGRLQPEMMVMNVAAKDAPLALQVFMKGFDVIAASLLLDDDLKVVNRRYRIEGPQRAIVETIVSIHAPLPRKGDTWESPTQLAMGQGQTAKGILRFVREKATAVAPATESDKEIVKEKPLVKVKVSGVLKAEGVVAGRFIKDGTYTVTGEQTFDTRTHDWIDSRWVVEVDNQLANPEGLAIARAKGKMTVQSKALGVPGGATDSAKSKP